MRNLVLVPAGDNSLHRTYDQDRNFDLWVLYWGEDESKRKAFEAGADRVIALRGLKWELLRLAASALYTARNRWEGGYILYVDDDILFANGAADIERFFAIIAELRADNAQPAIGAGQASWEVTKAVEGCCCRAGNMVESMMPSYSADMFFKVVLPGLHALPHIQAGWGYEQFVQRFAESLYQRPVRTFIVDCVPATHTRPLGMGSSPQAIGWDEAFLLPGLSGLTGRTLGRFRDIKTAMEFEFPSLESWREGRVERLAEVRRARLAMNAGLDVEKPVGLMRFGARQLARRLRDRWL